MKNQIILAMDNEIPDGIELMAKTECSKKLYGYKIGSLWILDKGIQVLKDLKSTVLCDTDKKIILDMQKWGTDIPDIVTKQVNKVAPYVDELIVCPMGGGKQSLKAFADACANNGIKPICVLEMTHPDSDYFLTRYSMIDILEMACEFGIEKFVIPATKEPHDEYNFILRKYYPNGYKGTIEFYATGFKTQGGQTKLMVDFGVTKFIVGRAIYDAKKPLVEIENISKEINKV